MNNKLTFQNKIVSVFIIGVFTFLPLVMTDKYFNITLTKSVCFFICVFVLQILWFVSSKIQKKKEKSRKTRKGEKLPLNLILIERIKKMSLMDIAFAVFTVTGFFSMIFSSQISASFFGNNGRYMGYLFFILVYLSYLKISKGYVISERDFDFMQGTMILVCIIGFIQVMGFNPFYLLSGISQKNAVTFLSTIGNENVFSAYISLILPIPMYLFCRSEKSVKIRILYLCAFAVGILGQIISSSDSGYIALFCSFAVLLLLTLSRKKEFFRYLVLCLTFGFECLLFFLIRKSEISVRKTSFLTNQLTSFKLSVIMIALFLICLILFKFFPPDEKALKYIKTAFCILVCVLILSVATAFFYFSFINTSFDLGRFERYFRFSKSWGTNRGEIWSNCFKVFEKYPLLNKLFGCGQGNLSIAMKKYLSEKANIVDNAHNELLQYLMTTGIFGLGSYLLLVSTAVTKLIKKCEQNKLYGAILICSVAYFAQSAVNIIQPFTTPLFFLLISVSGCEKETLGSVGTDFYQNKK